MNGEVAPQVGGVYDVSMRVRVTSNRRGPTLGVSLECVLAAGDQSRPLAVPVRDGITWREVEPPTVRRPPTQTVSATELEEGDVLWVAGEKRFREVAAVGGWNRRVQVLRFVDQSPEETPPTVEYDDLLIIEQRETDGGCDSRY